MVGLPPFECRMSGRGAEVERCRRENRDAEGAELDGVWGGSVHSPLGEGSGVGAVPPPQKNFSVLHLTVATFSAFWALFFTVWLHDIHMKSSAFG